MAGFKKLFSPFILISVMSRSIEFLVLPVWKWNSLERFLINSILLKH